MGDDKVESYAAFVKKPIHVNDLKEQHCGSVWRRFEVEKIAVLSREGFARFSSELYGYYRFLYDHRDCMHMGSADGKMHCILVTTSTYREGILVEAEGYAYPRCASFVPDCHRLELDGRERLEKIDLSADLPDAYWQMGKRQNQEHRKER